MSVRRILGRPDTGRRTLLKRESVRPPLVCQLRTVRRTLSDCPGSG